MAKRIISLRNNEALIKIEGAVGANTIALATDLLGAWEVLAGTPTPTVNIVGIMWTSSGGGTATIARNSVNIVSCVGGYGSLTAADGWFDNGQNTSDIVITTATAEVQIWIKVHKAAGYLTKYQPEQFGSYDDPTSISA